MIQNKNKLFFSSMSDEKISQTILSQDLYLEKILNNTINLNNYTNKFDRVGLIFMAIDPTTKSFRPDKKFNRWKQKVFDMYINVPDYDKFRTATKTEAQRIIVELYLSGIKKYLSKQKDFKHELFYKDVKELFEKEGILTKN